MPAHQNPSRSLPVKASAEYLRKEAKRFAKRHGLKLAAAQRALAHQYGHPTWADLMIAAKATIRPSHTAIRDGSQLSKTSGAPQLRDEEWTIVTGLAKMSLAEMPVVPSVKEWLDNRRSFTESEGIQQYFVATLGEQIVGFACAEHPPAWIRGKQAAAGEYRLFVVVEPSARRTLGSRLLATLRESLIGFRARRAWFQEYEADAGLISFLQEKGFTRAVSFETDEGIPIVRLCMEAPFESLMQQTHRASEASADDPRRAEPR